MIQTLSIHKLILGAGRQDINAYSVYWSDLTYLLKQQIAVGRQAGDEILGEVQEGSQHLQGQVLARGALQHEGDHQEAAVLDHVLLHGLGGFHQLANEAQELGATGYTFQSIISSISSILWLAYFLKGLTNSPQCWIPLDVAESFVGHVQLREEREEHLDAANRVQGAVYRVRDHGLNVLQKQISI